MKKLFFILLILSFSIYTKSQYVTLPPLPPVPLPPTPTYNFSSVPTAYTPSLKPFFRTVHSVPIIPTDKTKVPKAQVVLHPAKAAKIQMKKNSAIKK
jgi:hypothetical protein